jgi:hypothetical protein
MKIVEELESWYSSQCNGDWEHTFGITIQTLDNPGWHFEVDLADTELSDLCEHSEEYHKSDEDWLIIRISSAKFVGMGDAKKLRAIIEAFGAFRNGRWNDKREAY